MSAPCPCMSLASGCNLCNELTPCMHTAGAELMQSEPSEGSEKLQIIAKVLHAFKTAYNQHRCLDVKLQDCVWQHVGSAILVPT